MTNKILFVICTIFIINGCSSLSPKQLEKTHFIEGDVVKRHFMYEDKNFEIKRSDNTSKRDVIMQAIANELKEKASKYSKGLAVQVNHNTKIKDNTIKLYNEEQYNGVNENTVAKYKVKLFKRRDFIEATMTCPDFFEEVRANTRESFNREGSLKSNQASDLFKKVCKKAYPVIKWSRLTRGKVNIALKPSQFKNKFYQKITPYKTEIPPEKFKMYGSPVYKINLNPEEVEVAFKVYKYLSGGRIFYSFKREFLIKPNGETTYPKDKIEKKAKSLENWIEKIVKT